VITIVKASTLAALKTQAARARELGQRTAQAEELLRAAMADSLHAQEAQAAAEAAQAKAEARYTALYQDTLAGVMRAKIAVSDPRTGHAFQAEIALKILRSQIAEAKASGDPDLANRIRVLDALLGQDITLSHEAGTTAPRTAVSDIPDSPNGSPS
jgi:hypothetical protein